MRSWLLRSACLLAALGWVRSAEPLPAAPGGFSWARLAEIRADILKPAGWSVSRKRKGDSETYRMEASKSGRDAGSVLEINWVPKVPEKAQMSPSKYAAGLVAAAAENHKLLDRASGTQGAFASASFRFLDSGKGRDGIMVRYQFLANDRSGSLCIAAFEAPAKNWTNAWETGRVILDAMRLDPEF